MNVIYHSEIEVTNVPPRERRAPMICLHQSIQEAHTGATSECISCRLPIIFDGTKWQWFYGLDPRKTAKYRRAWDIDKLTGKHQS